MTGLADGTRLRHFRASADGSLRWRSAARGLEKARVKLQGFATETTNECFAIHIPSKEIVARVNAPSCNAKRIFQIGYDQQLLVARADLLRRCGYEVTSVFGNEAAKAILSALPHHDLFVIGHAASEQTRLEMVRWLRANYPRTRIVALNPPHQKRLDHLNYNAPYDAPDQWLPLVAEAAGYAEFR